MKYGSFPSQMFTVIWQDLDWYEGARVQHTACFMFCFRLFHGRVFCKRTLYVRYYFIFYPKEGVIPCGAVECGLVGGKQESPGKLFGLCLFCSPLPVCLSPFLSPLWEPQEEFTFSLQGIGGVKKYCGTSGGNWCTGPACFSGKKF